MPHEQDRSTRSTKLEQILRGIGWKLHLAFEKGTPMSFHYDGAGDEPIDLTCFDEDYERAGSRLGDGPAEVVPDGYYEVRVEEARLRRTPRTGNPMLQWKLRIVGPQCRNTAITKTRVITAKTLGFVKDDLRILGIALPRFSALEEHLSEMEDKVVNVYKRTTKEGWPDIYFTRARNGAAQTDQDVDSEDTRLFPPSADDVPF